MNRQSKYNIHTFTIFRQAPRRPKQPLPTPFRPRHCLAARATLGELAIAYLSVAFLVASIALSAAAELVLVPHRRASGA